MVREPALITPVEPTTMPLGLKKYKLPPILPLRIALTVPLMLIWFSTVFTKVCSAVVPFCVLKYRLAI